MTAPDPDTTSALLVYLDWNVVVSLHQREAPALLSSLERRRDEGRILLPFSATHVEEADNITGPTEEQRTRWIGERLDFLSQLSGDCYLYFPLGEDEPRLLRENPRSVHCTLRKNAWAKPIMHAMLKLLGTPKLMRAHRPQLGLDPNRLNAIKPPNVIEQLDRVVAEAVRVAEGEGAEPVGVRRLLEVALQHYPPEYHGFSNRVAALFSALNSFGFWPDKGGDSQAIASLNPAMHTANAAYTDVLVCEDKRMRVKTAAVYEFLGVSTRVVDTAGLLHALGPE